MGRITGRIVAAASVMALSCLSWPAIAQGFVPDQVDKAAAVKEGNLSWYTSTPFPLVQLLADRFTADTGVKVTLLRSGGEAVLRRFLQEYQAGQAGADVITMSDPGAASGMTRRGMFVPFKPEGFDKVVEGAKDKDGHWIAQRVHLIGMRCAPTWFRRPTGRRPGPISRTQNTRARW
jgi:iron(III) transport system substrate-binding protein